MGVAVYVVKQPTLRWKLNLSQAEMFMDEFKNFGTQPVWAAFAFDNDELWCDVIFVHSFREQQKNSALYLMFYIVLCLCSTDIEIKTVVKHWYDMTISICAESLDEASRSPNSLLTFCEKPT